MCVCVYIIDMDPKLVLKRVDMPLNKETKLNQSCNTEGKHAHGLEVRKIYQKLQRIV